MSMIMQWSGVSGEQVAALLTASSEDLWEWLESEAGLAHTFDLDKAWHGVHATLTGTDWASDTVLGQAVLGGTEFGEDDGYGPPRHLPSAQVAEIADALDQLGTERFAASIDLALLRRLDIYPSTWDDPAEVTWLTESFEILRAGYRPFADQGLDVVVTLT